jgi:hypothetical protein
MPDVSLFHLALYAIDPAVALIVAVILYRRKWMLRYPAFFTFLCFKFLQSAIFLPLAIAFSKTHSIAIYKVYFYGYWCAQTIEAVLVLLIVYRIFNATFSKYAVLRQWTVVIYLLALAACLLLATFVLPSAIRARGVISIIVPLWQGTLLLRTGMLAFLFLVAFGIGISIRDYLFGVAAGLGIHAAITLGVTTLLVRMGGARVFSQVETAADWLAVGIWFVYLFVPREDSQISDDLIGRGQELAGWNKVLSEFLHK